MCTKNRYFNRGHSNGESSSPEPGETLACVLKTVRDRYFATATVTVTDSGSVPNQPEAEVDGSGIRYPHGATSGSTKIFGKMGESANFELDLQIHSTRSGIRF